MREQASQYAALPEGHALAQQRMIFLAIAVDPPRFLGRTHGRQFQIRRKCFLGGFRLRDPVRRHDARRRSRAGWLIGLRGGRCGRLRGDIAGAGQSGLARLGVNREVALQALHRISAAGDHARAGAADFGRTRGADFAKRGCDGRRRPFRCRLLGLLGGRLCRLLGRRLRRLGRP